jgi:hypothetical protein
VGRIVPTVGRIKITGQTCRLAVRTNVDIYRQTIDTVETSANNVLLATTSTLGKDTEFSGENHSLEALDAGVLDYRKEEVVGVNGQQGKYCCHLRDSASFDLSERLFDPWFDRKGGFTRKGWIGWMLWTSLRPTLLHKKASRCSK